MIPGLVAHRGYMQNYPENTLLGLQKALDAGACMVEFDVQLSADRELIVIHDADLARTAGRQGSVLEMKQSELACISVHEPQRLGDTYEGCLIPTLKQVMDLVALHPGAMAFVEIKDESLERWGLEWSMNKLQQALQSYREQSVIISFNYGAMAIVKQQAQFRAGWVLENYDAAHRERAEQLKPDYLICNHKKIINESSPWKGSWQWMLYDITDPDLALSWAKRNVALIETCDIGTMLNDRILAERACTYHA